MADSDPVATFGHAAAELDRLGLAYLHLVEQFGEAPLSDADRAVLAAVRERWHGAYVANGAYDGAKAAEAVASGWATAVAFGVPFIANPDLPLRLLQRLPLAEADQATFYTGGRRGYVDYPAAGLREAA